MIEKIITLLTSSDPQLVDLGIKLMTEQLQKSVEDYHWLKQLLYEKFGRGYRAGSFQRIRRAFQNRHLELVKAGKAQQVKEHAKK